MQQSAINKYVLLAYLLHKRLCHHTAKSHTPSFVILTFRIADNNDVDVIYSMCIHLSMNVMLLAAVKHNQLSNESHISRNFVFVNVKMNNAVFLTVSGNGFGT